MDFSMKRSDMVFMEEQHKTAQVLAEQENI